MYDRKYVHHILYLMEISPILIRRKVGVPMLLRRKRIGGGLGLKPKVAADGVKRKGKLAY